MSQLVSRQFLLFLLTGGFAAIVNFLSRILYSNWLSFSTAVILAYITGMITAFSLAKIFVFKESKRALHHSAFYFALVNLFAILQTWLISMGLNYYLLPFLGIDFHNEDLAHAVGLAIPVFTSYFGHKRYSFR